MNILLVYPYEGDQPVRKIKLKRALERLGHRVDEFLVATSSEPGMGFIRRIRLIFRSLMAAFQKRGYDIIHIIEGWPVAQFPFLINKTPKVYDVRSHWAYLIRRERYGRKYRIWAWVIEQLMKLLVRHSDHITIVDPQIAQSVLQMRPRSWSLLRNLPEKDFLKISTDPRNERPILKGAQKDLVFGYLGAISRQRGIKDMLMAWQEFIKKHPACRLKIVGITQSNFPFFTDQIQPFLNKLRDTVEFQDPIHYNEVPHFYHTIDVMLVTSKDDHYPLKAGEALAAGKPIVLREGPMRKALFGNKGVVWYPRVEDEEREWLAIKNALEKVVVEYDLLHEEVQQIKIPMWEDEVERLEKVYNRLLRS